MARKQRLVAALGLVGWLAMSGASHAQTVRRVFQFPPRVEPASGQPLINDQRSDVPADNNPFAAPEQEAASDDNPFGDNQAADAAPSGGPSTFEVQPSHNKPPHTPRPACSNERIWSVLQSPTRMEFTEMPLADAVAFLSDYHGILIQLDLRALEDAGVGSDTPMNRNVNGIPLSSALRLLLGEVDLDYVVKNDVLMITTKDVADATTETRVYNVTEAIGSEVTAEEAAKMLSTLLGTNVPVSNGGGIVVESVPAGEKVIPFRNLLIVHASQRDHEELGELFQELKSKLKTSH